MAIFCYYSNMTKQEQIVAHLVNKYKPLAILLTGSRAKGYAKQDSDWDLIILTNGKNEYAGELFLGEELDTHLKDIKEIQKNILDNNWSPYQAIDVLYDHTNGRVRKIVTTTIKSFKKGPPSLSKLDHEARKNFDRRKIKKLEHLLENQNAFFEYLGIFFNAIIAH